MATTDQSAGRFNTGVRTGLSAGDVNMLQALYGARTADRYEGTAGNGTFATAAVMKLPNIAADITTAATLSRTRA